MTNGRLRSKVIAIITSVACLALVGSCSAPRGPSKSKSPSSMQEQPNKDTTNPSSPPPPRSDRSRIRINALYSQILKWTVGASPDAAVLGKVCTAPEPKTTQCQDVCRVTGSICGNSSKICELAKGIPDDTWAAEKCVAATAACERATKRCCGCVNRE